jgi:hypothetical protein
MHYIKIFKTAYLIAITINLVLLYYKGPAFKDSLLLQFVLNCIAILINITTFYLLKNRVAIFIEKVLSIIRMVVILLIASIIFIAPVITIIPTGYIFWFTLLDLLDFFKIEGPSPIWVVCATLLILEVLFFRNMMRFGREKADLTPTPSLPSRQTL